MLQEEDTVHFKGLSRQNWVSNRMGTEKLDTKENSA